MRVHGFWDEVLWLMDMVHETGVASLGAGAYTQIRSRLIAMIYKSEPLQLCETIVVF